MTPRLMAQIQGIQLADEYSVFDSEEEAEEVDAGDAETDDDDLTDEEKEIQEVV